MGNLKERKVKNKKRVAIFLSLCMTMVMLVGTLTTFAGIGGPISSIVSITPYSDFGAGSAVYIERSQYVEIIVELNTTVSAPSLNKEDFRVNITGAPGGGWIDGVTNPAMDFDVELLDGNTLLFTIFATNAAEVPNPTTTNNTFDMKTGLVTITAASGTTIPSIIDSGTASPLYWPAGTFEHISVDSGVNGYSHDSVPADTVLGIAPSVQLTFTEISAVRGAVYVAGTSSVNGYIEFSSVVPAKMHYGAPIHAHNFYSMSLANYAIALVYTINLNSATTGCVAEIVGTPGASSTVRLTKTAGYDNGETLNLYILDYTNQ